MFCSILLMSTFNITSLDADRINTAINKVGIDEGIIHSIIAVESGYDSTATSGAGARGLMQLMPIAVEDVRNNSICQVPEVINYYDIDVNIYLGGCYLSLLLSRYDYNIPLALSAYNGGGRQATFLQGGKPLAAETARYVTKVMYTLSNYTRKECK